MHEDVAYVVERRDLFTKHFLNATMKSSSG